MKDIFSDLYNKVMSFFVTTQETDQTKEKAMNRLKVVLMQDRVGFSERAMQMMKEEIVSSISKYLEIDEDLFELQLDSQDDKTMLMLSIPVMRAKTDDEIDLALKEQAEKTQVKAETLVQELEEIIEERAQVLAEELLEHKENGTDDDTEANEDKPSDDVEDEQTAEVALEDCSCENKSNKKKIGR